MALRRALKYSQWLLSPRRLALLLRVLGCATLGRLLIGRMNFATFMERWTRPLGRKSWDREELAAATDLGLLAIGRRRCLMRSLVLYRLLRQAGYPSEFVMGVRPDPEKGILAHAWLERDGREIHPYGDSPELYTVSYRYP